MWNRGNTSGIFNLVISYLDSTLSDHGIFRILWRSWGELPGEMFRSNQPYPFQIRRDIKKYNIKSIINLRGARHCSSYYLEKKICKKSKIKLYNFPISSRDIPDKNKLIGFKELLDKVEYPCLMHCKSGADRAGLASALYLIYKRNYSLVEASNQLSLKHLHIKYTKTGILDHFFSELIKKNIVSKSNFLNWLKSDYNKEDLKKSFKMNSFIDKIINYILRRE